MYKKKITLYVFLGCFIISLFGNYTLYKENQRFKKYLGERYKVSAQIALFHLKEGDTKYWISELQQEDGQVQLERHLGRLQQLTTDLLRMDAISIVGHTILSIEHNYRTLAKQIDSGESVDDLVTVIEDRIRFIRTVVSKLVEDFGEDDMLWYTELSNHNSNTAKYVQEQYS